MVLKIPKTAKISVFLRVESLPGRGAGVFWW